MPIIQLHHPQGSLDEGRKAALAQGLTDVLLTMEGGAKTPGGLAFASVLFTEVPDGDWWVGGCSDTTHVSPPGRFLAHVSIPEGYMNLKCTRRCMPRSSTPPVPRKARAPAARRSAWPSSPRRSACVWPRATETPRSLSSEKRMSKCEVIL